MKKGKSGLNFVSRFIGKTIDGIKNDTTNRILENTRQRVNTPGTEEYERDQRLKKNVKEYGKRLETEKESNKKYDKLLISLPNLKGDKLEKTIKELKSIQKNTRFASKPHSVSYFRDISTKGGTFKNFQGKKIIISGSNEINKSKGITKDEAISKLKELKELFDLTVISKDEFEKKSAPLKKIILKD